MTAEGKTLKEQYQWEAKSQWEGQPLEGEIEVSITLYFGTKRRADLDNFNKLSLDPSFQSSAATTRRGPVSRLK
jgi:Holliday junction resolvase RusA-like endonuclease